MIEDKENFKIDCELIKTLQYDQLWIRIGGLDYICVQEWNGWVIHVPHISVDLEKVDYVKKFYNSSMFIRCDGIYDIPFYKGISSEEDLGRKISDAPSDFFEMLTKR